MQLAINEVGRFKVLLGAIAAAFGKAIGRSGDFYRVAGRELAKIDDIAGTLPPFDGYIVLGPKNRRKSPIKYMKKIGVTTAIADINDLKCVDILAITGEISEEQIIGILQSNPLGNDDQQTPLVVLKRVG